MISLTAKFWQLSFFGAIGISTEKTPGNSAIVTWPFWGGGPKRDPLTGYRSDLKKRESKGHFESPGR